MKAKVPVAFEGFGPCEAAAFAEALGPKLHSLIDCAAGIVDSVVVQGKEASITTVFFNFAYGASLGMYAVAMPAFWNFAELCPKCCEPVNLNFDNTHMVCFKCSFGRRETQAMNVYLHFETEDQAQEAVGRLPRELEQHLALYLDALEASVTALSIGEVIKYIGDLCFAQYANKIALHALATSIKPDPKILEELLT